jgi:hypothetical protein
MLQSQPCPLPTRMSIVPPCPGRSQGRAGSPVKSGNDAALWAALFGSLPPGLHLTKYSLAGRHSHSLTPTGLMTFRRNDSPSRPGPTPDDKTGVRRFTAPSGRQRLRPRLSAVRKCRSRAHLRAS